MNTLHHFIWHLLTLHCTFTSHHMISHHTKSSLYDIFSSPLSHICKTSNHIIWHYTALSSQTTWHYITISYFTTSCFYVTYISLSNHIVCVYCISHVFINSFYLILFYSILFYSILFYSILFYSILFYSILFYSILSYPPTHSLIHLLIYQVILSYLILHTPNLFYPSRDESQRVFDTAQAELKRIEVEVGGLKNLRALHAKVRRIFSRNVLQCIMRIFVRNVLQNIQILYERFIPIIRLFVELF